MNNGVEMLFLYCLRKKKTGKGNFLKKLENVLITENNWSI